MATPTRTEGAFAPQTLRNIDTREEIRPSVDQGIASALEALKQLPDTKEVVKHLEDRPNPIAARSLACKLTLKAIGYMVAMLLLTAAFVTAAILICTLLSNPLVIGLALGGLALAGIGGLLINMTLCGKCCIATANCLALRSFAKMDQKAIA